MKILISLLVFLTFYLGCEASLIDTLSVKSKFLNSIENVVVISPEISKEKSCPTVYLLNGHTGNHLSWMNIRQDLPELADKYGIIFVMPDGKNSWYWDSPVDSTMRMESFITMDLIPIIDSKYNTIPNPEKRAISGLSMGGHGAMWLALRHPELWKNVGSTSGGLDIRPFPENWDMKYRLGDKNENEELWDNHTVINLIPDVTKDYYNIIIDCGTEDFFFEVNNAAHDSLLEHSIKHDYIVRPGGHTIDYWSNSILYHLLFFSENFKE